MQLVVISVTRNRKGQPVRVARTLDGESFVVGRGARCEIHLPDPRVALEHATIYRSEGKTRLTAVGSAKLLVDGRPDPEAILAPGSRVEIGPYAVTVEAPSPGADLAIAIELLRPLPDDLAEIKRRSRMSLAVTGLAKRWPAWVLAGIVLALFVVIPILDVSVPMLRTMTSRLSVTPEQSWSPGPLASGHDAFGHDCRKCHERPFIRVRDGTCLGCHQNVTGHAPTAELQAQLFGRTRCATCHADHKGDEGLVQDDARTCAGCHRDLKRRFADTTIADASDFASAHPAFRLALWRGPGPGDVVRVAQDDKASLTERSRLKFPHAAHLKQSIRGAKGRVTLTCRSCHVPDASGRSFEPVAMTKHCLECHTLEFEPAVTSRQVPHGSVDGVMQTMQEFYANLALNRVAVDTIDTGDIRRRIPGPAGSTITDEQRQRALAWARTKGAKVAQDLFEARVCIVCHDVVKTMGPRGEQDGIAYGVAPVHVNRTWLPAARFDHDKHRTYKCEDCHDKVGESKSSADVSIPTIETCRKCHAGSAPVANKVASTCIDCHGFHLPGHPPMDRTRTAGARP